MSVRIVLGLVLAAATGGAQASSLIFPGAPVSTPSIISLGTPNQMKAADARSVVAVGDADPDVTYEKVAAIPDKPKARHGFQQGLMVIRGGIVGPTFSAPTPTAAPTPVTAAVPATGSAPGTATASAGPAGDAGGTTPPSAPAQASTRPMPASGNAK